MPTTIAPAILKPSVTPSPVKPIRHDKHNANGVRRIASAVVLKAIDDLQGRPTLLAAWLASPDAAFWLNLANVTPYSMQPTPLSRTGRGAKWLAPDIAEMPDAQVCPCGKGHNYKSTNGLCMSCYGKQRHNN